MDRRVFFFDLFFLGPQTNRVFGLLSISRQLSPSCTDWIFMCDTPGRI